jgi:hypothetical protein
MKQRNTPRDEAQRTIASTATDNAIIDRDPQRVQAFLERLGQCQEPRIKREELWSFFNEFFPHRSRNTEGRQWLLESLYEAEQQGIIKLPVAHGVSWDHSLFPAIPVFVDRIVTKVKRDASWRTFPWHYRLTWVAALRTLPADQEAFLYHVHEGLVEGTFQEPAPLKYRSLQLTGHEKHLGKLAQTVLFGPGRLTFELLGCVPDIPPLVLKRVGERNVALVFENVGSFRTAYTVLKRLQYPSYGLVGFGAGKSFARSILDFRLLDRNIERIEYVGDMDRPGLHIAQSVTGIAEAEGLPPVVPAKGIHYAMLESVRRFGYPDGMEYKVDERRSEPGDEALVAWLTDDVRANILTIIRAGRRIPEEILGPAEMLHVWEERVE